MSHKNEKKKDENKDTRTKNTRRIIPKIGKKKEYLLRKKRIQAFVSFCLCHFIGFYLAERNLLCVCVCVCPLSSAFDLNNPNSNLNLYPQKQKWEMERIQNGSPCASTSFCRRNHCMPNWRKVFYLWAGSVCFIELPDFRPELRHHSLCCACVVELKSSTDHLIRSKTEFQWMIRSIFGFHINRCTLLVHQLHMVTR